jgi:hypothetical protein
MKRVPVNIRIDGDGANVELFACPYDATGNFTPVSDEDLLEYAFFWKP